MGMKVNGTSGLTFPDTTTLASAGQASVQAWVNFNGTGTVAIRAAYNVASITDNGTGDYTVNFDTALADANFAALASGAVNDTAGGSGVTGRDIVVNNNTTTSTRLFTSNSSGVGLDFLNTFVAIFR